MAIKETSSSSALSESSSSQPQLPPAQEEGDRHTLTSKADERYGSKFLVLTQTDQIHELQTLIRDIETSRSHFKFVADRLIRLVIEEGLNQLPYSETEVKTPTGKSYQGLKFGRGNCGVSIVRSGEAMEKALQVRDRQAPLIRNVQNQSLSHFSCLLH